MKKLSILLLIVLAAVMYGCGDSNANDPKVEAASAARAQAAAGKPAKSASTKMVQDETK